MDLPTRADLYQIGRGYVLARARRIDPSRVDVLGSDVNLFVGTQSVTAYSIVKQLAFRTGALLLDGAQGEDLDRYAWDRYQLTRKGASPALGTERFFRATAVGGAGTIKVGTVIKSRAGVPFITTQPAVFAVGQLDKVFADVRAQKAGKASEVGANQLQKIDNVQALFDPTIQCTNDATTAGGEDVEDDDTFRNRIREFWLTARRAILAAIEFGAKSVPGVVTAVAVEALTGGALPARVVNLYIADSSGVASAALGRQVAIALNDFRAAGIAVIINTSVPLLVNVKLALQFQAGVDTLALSQNVVAAVVEFINSLPVNGTLYVLQLGSVLQRFASQGLIVNQSSIVAPVGDLVPPLGQTLRATTTTVTLA